MARADETERLETGHVGRIAFARIRPNEDLVQSVEKLALRHGFRAAFVRGSLGSLTDACVLNVDGQPIAIRGPAVEVLSIVGEVRPGPDGEASVSLSGILSGPDGQVRGGRFVSGRNPVCMTFELCLEEWCPDEPDASRRPA